MTGEAFIALCLEACHGVALRVDERGKPWDIAGTWPMSDNIVEMIIFAGVLNTMHMTEARVACAEAKRVARKLCIIEEVPDSHVTKHVTQLLLETGWKPVTVDEDGVHIYAVRRR